MISTSSYLKKAVLTVFLSCLMLCTAQAATPLWTMVPATGSNPTKTVPVNNTAVVQYLVNNQSARPKQLMILPMPGITQTTECQLAPKGQAGSSCLLTLAIKGAALPSSGIRGGPKLCQTNPNGTPNPNQCYQPSAANSLNIERGPAALLATISVSPRALLFTVNTSSSVTVSNSASSSTSAKNILASIPNGSTISVQSTTCGASLAVGASCTITFTAPAVEGPTTIAIAGDNSNSVNIVAAVVNTPVASISVAPTILQFTENSSGSVTVTNSAASLVSANNVVASIPGGSAISVQSSTCGASLAIGASCTITFASSTEEGPTVIPIAGDNSNTVDVFATVNGQPTISISAPAQQDRVVEASAAMNPLALEITNDASSVVNANAITVSDNSACPGLVIDDTNCVSVAPGASCTLQLSSGTPYAPCNITISGSNTANSPQTLIAFSLLGGIVFEESGGSGKIFIDEAQQFTSLWTFGVTNIAAAESATDGVANTNAIVASAACTGSPGSCAAQLCRDIDPAWYLPAQNELISARSAFCSNGTTPCNFAVSSSNIYWSSTQFDNLSANAVPFASGAPNNLSKFFSQPVRCIRAF